MAAESWTPGTAAETGPTQSAPVGLGSSVLVIDDEPGMRSFLQRGLARHFALVEVAGDTVHADALLSRCHFDLLIADIRLPGRTGVEWVQELRDSGSSLDVIFITAHADLQTAIAALRAGAADFILKPFRIDQLLAAVERVTERRKLSRENYLLHRETDKRFALDGVVGSCEPMKEVCRIINRLAPMRSTVLIQGESGTGKELAARAIHERSERPGSFVAINCGAVSPELLESELFGHAKGAFTGAYQAREGLFSFAHGGSLFLDEVGEMPQGMQAKLLRVLEEKTIRPVGGNQETPVDVRIIAATNRDLGQEVEAGRFRADLFYRLNVVAVRLPPLRERIEDIQSLVQFFLNLNVLSHLAGSFGFRTDLARDDNRALALLVERARQQRGFAFLHLVDRQGKWITVNGRSGMSRPSRLLEQAWIGEPSVGIEIYSAEHLKGEEPALADSVRLRLLPTPRAVPTGRQLETRAMMIRAVYPVRDANDNVRAVLDGGVLLNGNFAFVDSIRDLVYGPGSLPRDSIGTVTVFLDDVRISTNVPLGPDERALGTRVSREVREHVLGRGERWVDRAFVVNDWYISAYEPIRDISGRRIGMLYTGFLDEPFRSELRGALLILLSLFAGLALISAAVAVGLSKSIFKPLEVMSGVMHATRKGKNRRIGGVISQDEIGELAREFDAMLDLLRLHHRQIQEAAESLEIKVDERTIELRRRNRELERTIQVLRETRRQLIRPWPNSCRG